VVIPIKLIRSSFQGMAYTLLELMLTLKLGLFYQYLMQVTGRNY